eukprot:GGOE01050599.1.p1 GENE.GGOE01050599.1~~GGOE01050599.1.p1  ORF type:complete len:903 (+),score=200.21 GGOE01050599.1:300-2711(+)
MATRRLSLHIDTAEGDEPLPTFEAPPPPAGANADSQLWDLETGAPYRPKARSPATKDFPQHLLRSAAVGSWDIGAWDQGWWDQGTMPIVQQTPSRFQVPPQKPQWEGSVQAPGAGQQMPNSRWDASQGTWGYNQQSVRDQQPWDTSASGWPAPPTGAAGWTQPWQNPSGSTPSASHDGRPGWTVDRSTWDSWGHAVPRWAPENSDHSWSAQGWRQRQQQQQQQQQPQWTQAAGDWHRGGDQTGWQREWGTSAANLNFRPGSTDWKAQWQPMGAAAPEWQRQAPKPEVAPSAPAEVPAPPPAISQAALRDIRVRPHLSDRLFQTLPLSAPLQSALALDLNVSRMTVVQERILPLALEGKDLAVKAKAGTGKTLAALLPVAQQLYQGTRPRDKISAVVLTATQQGAAVVKAYCAELAKHLVLKADAVGDVVDVNQDFRSVKWNVDLLAATPGRLLENCQSTPGLAEKLSGVRFLILDDADLMAQDRSVWGAVEKVVGYLPPPAQRQTLLVASSFPTSLLQSLSTLTRGANTELVGIDTDDEPAEVQEAPRAAIVLPYLEQWPTLMAVLRQEIQKPPFKIAVFFPTARIAQAVAELFAHMGITVLETHIRKSGAHRNLALEQFRRGENVILFSADVPPALAMNLIGVTCIIQVGMCVTPQQYALRMGLDASGPSHPPRTVLLLAEFERPFLRLLMERFPLAEVGSPVVTKGDRAILSRGVQQLLQSKSKADAKDRATQMYVSWLGFYLEEMPITGLTKTQTVAAANAFVVWLFSGRVPPAVMPSTVTRMQLEGVEGILVDDRKFNV